ncbi:1-acyl-sn-glycerol-3-phosphate acyltransferase [Roseimarinus sediminis]|uniref:1-acyl-sn-glycerol-3-phosphate acyltransferase n=1 Tax=Roseimarinus sediminis TaxID=1610899 RepID=UPI003D2327C8
MTSFEEIRPYHNEEFATSIKALVEDQHFRSMAAQLYPQPGMSEVVLQKMSETKSVEELQETIIYPLLREIEKNTTDGLSYSAMEQFHPDERYLFISNHRDIILDAAFLNVVMQQHGFRKTEIAIGNNLLIFDWIEKLVRLNRAFVVKRNLGVREQLEASKTLSAYIRYAITQKGESVWIAQREGRTKDGNDQTQPALLKMLGMSYDGKLIEGFRELNIVPMAISYEIEPCGISKVEELLKRKYQPDYTKTAQDDLRSMGNGVMQAKGRVHFSFGNPMNIRIDELTKGKNKGEAIKAMVSYIDQRVYANYKLWPNNYIAFDLLNNSSEHQSHYSEAEKEKFVAMMKHELQSIHFDYNEASEKYLYMYATPVINYQKFVLNA